MLEDILGPTLSSIISEAARQGTRNALFSTYQMSYLFRNQQDGREQMKRVLEKVVLSKTKQNEWTVAIGAAFKIVKS